MKYIRIAIVSCILSVGNAFAYVLPVVDVNAVPQWISQLAHNVKELVQLKEQYDQLKAQYEALTSNHNFGSFLMGAANRQVYEALPLDLKNIVDQAGQVSGQVSKVSRDIEKIRQGIAALTNTKFGDENSAQARAWKARVDQIASQRAMGQTVYDQGGVSIGRLEELTSEINSTGDIKGSSDLNIRMNAELGQLTNLQNRLIALRMMQDAEVETIRLQQAERVRQMGSKPAPKVDYSGAFRRR